MGNTVIAIPGARSAQRPMLNENSLGSHWTIATVTMSSSYATGGDACDITGFGGVFGRSQPLKVLPFPKLGYVPVWDSANKKMLVYWQSAATSALTEVTSTTDLHTVTFDCIVVHP